jgi:hypothetical protein
MSRREPVVFLTVFDERFWTEDMAAASAAGRAVAEDWRSRFERDGISEEILMPCQAEGPSGTDLTGCGKVRIPPPAGEHGMVFELDRDASGRIVLAFLAFGLRHPPPGRRVDVYQRAHRRHYAEG